MSDGIPDCADKDSPQNLRHITVFVCPKRPVRLSRGQDLARRSSCVRLPGGLEGRIIQNNAKGDWGYTGRDRDWCGLTLSSFFVKEKLFLISAP
jgi:hypothetical protein